PKSLLFEFRPHDIHDCLLCKLLAMLLTSKSLRNKKVRTFTSDCSSESRPFPDIIVRFRTALLGPGQQAFISTRLLLMVYLATEATANEAFRPTCPVSVDAVAYPSCRAEASCTIADGSCRCRLPRTCRSVFRPGARLQS